MKIEKLPSGSYRIQKQIYGRRYSFTFDHKPTKKEIQQAIDGKVHSAPTGDNITFKQAAELYIDSKRDILSPSTIIGYNKELRAVSDHFCNTRLSSIDQITLQYEINKYSSTHSPKSTRNHHGFISAVLRQFKPHMIINTNLPRKAANTPYIPSDDEVKRVLEYLQGKPTEIAILLCCFGLRRSEVCALTIDDLNGNLLTINKALVYTEDKKWIVKETKTEASVRTIYLPDDIVNKINQQGYIYKGSPHRLYKHLQEALMALGIERFPLHKLRHYFASRMHSLGIPDKFIQQMGGWATDETLKQIYQHASPDQIDDMQKFGAEYLSELIL